MRGSIADIKAVVLGSCMGLVIVGTASAADGLGSYIKNKNVSTLERLLTAREVDQEVLLKSALFSGLAITYGFALEPGGAKKFQDWTFECYDKAFESGQMRSIMGCYVAVTVVVDQIEKLTKSKLKDRYDQVLVQEFVERGITDAGIIRESLAEFTAAWKRESDFMETLTVKQVSDCLEYGVGKQCKF